MLIAIDAWILEKFERFAHWFQKMFARDCFWLARICCIFLAFALWMDSFADGREFFISILYSCFVSFLWLSNIFIVERGIPSRDTETPSANPERGNVFFRIFTITSWLTIFISIGEITNIPWMICFIAVQYFMACDPLPPGKAKAKELLKEKAKSLAETLSPAPEPMPVPAKS